MTFLRRRGAALGLLAAVVVTLFGLAAVVAFSSRDQERASAAATTDLPPEKPRRDLPKVLDGTVFDSARVGDWIVVGGDFTQIELQNGDVVAQGGAFAYHVDTGAFNENFRPTFTRNSNVPVVLAVAPAGTGTDVFLGGKFGSVNGQDHRRLTKVGVGSGAVRTSFAAIVDGPVRDIVVANGRVYVGGEFESINGKSRSRLAALNPGSGSVDPSFRFDITETTRPAGEPFGPKYLGITPDNTLVVAHRGRRVKGQPRTGIALIDLTSKTLDGWRTDFWGQNIVTTIDAEVSPDGSYLVLGGNGGDFPFMGRDAAVAFSLTSKQQANQQPLWIARNFDSTYAIGISSDAVFIGGHFCWVESTLAPDPWPGDGEFTNNNSCHGDYPASRFAPYVVYRDQIAALDPATGHALVWDPGSDGLEGVQSIEVIDRGLLIGHDGQFFGRDGKDSRAWNVGRHAFLDTTDQIPRPNTSLFIDRPVIGTCDGLQPTITGTTRDDALVGTSGPDVILAGPGNDVVRGGGGNDVICGGSGLDLLRGEGGNDRLFGDDDRDRLFGGDGADRLLGGGGMDIVAGERGNDTLIGGRAGDRMNGGAGSDTLKGSPGRDRLQGGVGADTILGGIGWDICAGRTLGQADNPGDTITDCEE